jgi:hypothetical protein
MTSTASTTAASRSVETTGSSDATRTTSPINAQGNENGSASEQSSTSTSRDGAHANPLIGKWVCIDAPNDSKTTWVFRADGTCYYLGENPSGAILSVGTYRVEEGQWDESQWPIAGQWASVSRRTNGIFGILVIGPDVRFSIKPANGEVTNITTPDGYDVDDIRDYLIQDEGRKLVLSLGSAVRDAALFSRTGEPDLDPAL